MVLRSKKKNLILFFSPENKKHQPRTRKSWEYSQYVFVVCVQWEGTYMGGGGGKKAIQVREFCH